MDRDLKISLGFSTLFLIALAADIGLLNYPW